MAIYIDHKDFIDVRDIAEEIQKHIDVLEDENADSDEKQDARDTLDEYKNAIEQLGQNPNSDEDLCDSWMDFANSGDVTVVWTNYFPEYAEEMVKDLGYISDELPDFIKNNIDWEAVADDLKVDYTEFEMDGFSYLLRLG